VFLVFDDLKVAEKLRQRYFMLKNQIFNQFLFIYLKHMESILYSLINPFMVPNNNNNNKKNKSNNPKSTRILKLLEIRFIFSSDKKSKKDLVELPISNRTH
jgi:hypothetical protein